MNYDWTPDRIEMLRALHTEGLPFSQIAAALGGGVTRNAVIGKAGRLKLAGRIGIHIARASVESIPRPRRAVVRRLARMKQRPEATLNDSPPMEPEAVPELPADTSPDACTMMDLRAASCRWPLGDAAGAETMFCGTEVARGSYCRRHGGMAYRSPPPRGGARPTA
jgi:GcrA cell cycle regulator